VTAYDFWKTAHVLSAAIILGTGWGIAFHCWSGYRGALRAGDVGALRSGDIGALRSVLRLSMIADAGFTLPAVAFQAASGAILMEQLGWTQLSTWAIAVWALFIFAGACWLPVLCIQAYLKRVAEGVPATEWLPRSFHLWFTVWYGLGVPAFAAVIAIYWLMIAKPLSVT